MTSTASQSSHVRLMDQPTLKPHAKRVEAASVEIYLNPRVQSARYLLYRRFDPPQDVATVASLCVFHGFAEHSGRYVDMAVYFSQRGVQVHLVDFRGCGMSGGVRNQGTIREFARDIETCLQQVDPALPCFIMGHSMGGLTVLRFCIDHPNLHLAGVIFSSALFRLHPHRQKGYFKRMLVWFGSFVPELFVMADVDPLGLTRDTEEVMKILNDRFCLPLMSMKLACSMVWEPYSVYPSGCHRFHYPCFVFHGEEDQLTDPGASCGFYKTCASEDKTLHLFKGAMHELHSDINRDEMHDMVLKWMLPRAERAKPLGAFDEYLEAYDKRQRQRHRRLRDIRTRIFMALVFALVAWLVLKLWSRGSFGSFMNLLSVFALSSGIESERS
ncbi:unnamed protein product [Vitrella brassicaformis CCMP3155]|uniref:Serine aminopeptidase S33 domain-containing protein n=1 Tax=Vitrella brassicaformis (strain CCMP3155) TaxID=1169540 RepID=A0A0G4F102_VITBC|nr:unnamed protein product [Vitrella brassicaformis CCMP3155]|eukprot:CEM05301.1 unnamed protein product [Vitrella brassicaformis CCMP3155]